MKIVCLNTWGGRAGKKKLLAFFETYKDSVDVFCLQEMWSDRYDNYEGVLAGGVPLDQSTIMTHALQEIGAVLPNHVPIFHPGFLDNFGLCMFVRKEIEIEVEGDIFVHRERGFVPTEDLGHYARNLQYVTLNESGRRITIMNFHGLWNGQGKGDSPDRLTQSNNIVQFLKTLDTPFVLCGDFNLLPETQSLKLIEGAGLRNLISEYDIKSTRTSLYDKPVGFADYAFVSEGIEVLDFTVLPEEVSDHAALRLHIA